MDSMVKPQPKVQPEDYRPMEEREHEMEESDFRRQKPGLGCRGFRV